MPPIILITRPEPGATRFVAALKDLPGDDLSVVLSPVLAIAPQGSLPDLTGVRWLIFTSQHGVFRFAELSARRDIPAYCVGDTTAEAAEQAGITAISAGGDARDLLARIAADGAAGPMLHLRGAHAAADVAGALTTAGVPAGDAVLYAQHKVPLNDAARACLSGTAPVIAPVFSPRSAAALFEGVDVTAPLVVLAISRAAADRVPEGAAQACLVADRPDGAGMLRAWPEALARAYRLEGTNRAQ
ncbi:uroporphyrinogen-III synthase [Roseovarius dicentrarchi]|uniref:uroporphyrinogen-III synthase n=1 Tax=Roseovarius dicentrarchi TaxID=2250573 RepID=UPI0013967328|nr:uroporphyrinogen-III synthase [Roseovarius dicentrarchi]